MPDNRSDTQKDPQVATLPAPAPALLRRWFPWIVSVIVAAADLAVAYQMNADVMSGKLSGLPYLCLAALFAAIFVVNHFLYRQE